MYGITGGIPMYLEQFSPNLTIKENLLKNLFDRNAALLNSKRPIYLIEDQFFRFWYTFVPKNISAIQSGRILILRSERRG